MSTSTNTIADLMQESLLKNSTLEYLQSFGKKNNETKDVFSLLEEQKGIVSSVLDKNGLQDLIDGKYDISLREYTNLTSYNTAMSSFLGNNSANPFQNTLNKIIGTNEDSLANAKSFVDTMKERGISNQSAVKMYSALQNYSVMNNLYNLNKSNFVSAKI